MNILICLYSLLTLVILIVVEMHALKKLRLIQNRFNFYRQFTTKSYQMVVVFVMILYSAVIVGYLASLSEFSMILLFGAQGAMIAHACIEILIRIFWRIKILPFWASVFGTFPAALLVIFVLLEDWHVSFSLKFQLLVAGVLLEVFFIMMMLVASKYLGDKKPIHHPRWEKFDD